MKLDPARFAEQVNVNHNWTVTVDEKTTLEDVLRPEFFGNVAGKFLPYDRLLIRTDTGEWYAELLVRFCGKTWAQVVVLFHIDLTERDTELPQVGLSEQFEIRWRGPHLKHCVIRMADHECVKEGCDTKAEAQSWLASYMLTI